MPISRISRSAVVCGEKCVVENPESQIPRPIIAAVDSLAHCSIMLAFFGIKDTHEGDTQADRIIYLETVVFNNKSSIQVDYNQLSQLDKNLLLLSAVKRNDMRVLRMLMHHKAYVDAQNDDGITALHLAVMMNNIDMTVALIQVSPPPSLTTRLYLL